MDVRRALTYPQRKLKNPIDGGMIDGNGRRTLNALKGAGVQKHRSKAIKSLCSLRRFGKRNFGIGEEYWLESGERGGESIHETQRIY